MKEGTTYCYKGSTEFVIENGILKGVENPNFMVNNNSGEFVLQHLKATPEFIGLIDGATGEEESFEKMMEKSVKCAMWLKEQNIQRGDIIGVCTYNQMDMYVPCLASLYIGSVLNTWWNIGITKEIVTHFLTSSCPKILFADEASADYIREVAEEIDMPLKIIVFGNLAGFQSLHKVLSSQDQKIVADFQCTKFSSQADPVALVYTSGSTGMPKVAVLSYKSVVGNLYIYCGMAGAEGTTISFNYGPLYWGTSVLGILRAVISRATEIMYPVFSEETTCQLIEKYKINWIRMLPNHLVRLEKSQAAKKYDLSSLKDIYVTGGVLKEKVHQKLAVDFPQTSIRQVYGLTEFGLSIRHHGEHLKYGSCGTIMKNMQMKVVDIESGLVVGPNQMGEAWFKTPFVMTCYHKKPKATSETIDAEGWLRTGDLVYYDKEGNIFMIDRMKDMIKYKDYRVSPGIIEQVLQEHPAVFEVGVVAKPNEIDGEHPMAFVVKSPNAHVTEEELLQLVATKLPDYMRLRGGLEFLEELKHTVAGKVIRRL